MRAFEYFNENVEGFYESPTTHIPGDGRGWDFERNPIAGNYR